MKDTLIVLSGIPYHLFQAYLCKRHRRQGLALE